LPVAAGSRGTLETIMGGGALTAAGAVCEARDDVGAGWCETGVGLDRTLARAPCEVAAPGEARWLELARGPLARSGAAW
jgi:hypothetical protein